MAAKKDKRIASATFMTSLIDFTAAGELEVFIDEEQVASLEKQDGRARLSRRQRDGEHVQHAARERPHLVVRHQQLPARPRPVPVRPPALELRLDAHAREDAQLLPAQHVHEEPAAQARRHDARRRADRPVEGRACRPTSSPRSRTTSRRGRRPTPARRSSAASRASCCPARATSPAWSIRRPRTSTATGRTRRCPTIRRPGSKARSSTPARGGPTG